MKAIEGTNKVVDDEGNTVTTLQTWYTFEPCVFTRDQEITGPETIVEYGNNSGVLKGLYYRVCRKPIVPTVCAF